MGHKPRLMSAGIVACLLFLLTPTATANKCIVGCHGMNPSKAYVEGHTYVYDLEGTSVTSVSEAQGESKLKLNAVVELAVKPDCVHQLRVKNLQVNGAPVSLKDVEKHALQFNYHNGHIDTSVCAEEGDSQASLNIKRAVASLFQSAVMQDSGATTYHETDVFGGCKTDFTFQKDGSNALVVNKYRDLANCWHRETIRHGLITDVFNPTAETKSTPLLASHLKTEQRFVDGVLNKALSSENYVLRPFSNGDAGAKTVVKMELSLKSDKPSSGPAGPVTQPKSLIFDPPHPVVDSSVGAIENALKAVKEECPETAVKEHAAIKFAELVKVFGVSSKNDIMSVYQKVKSGAGFDKKHDRKLFLDALFRSGSGEAAEVSTDLLKSNELVGTEEVDFYKSLALVQHVNPHTVNSVIGLLDQADIPRIGFLSIGHVIGKYCEQHACDGVPEVKAALGKLFSKAEGANKFDSREKENVGILALKALGNARYHDKPTSEKIAKIAMDKKVKNRVRVAAIDALPATCSMSWKKQLGDVLANREEDSEIRIKCYLALVRCPCPHVAKLVKEVLDKETVNQVGSFITSHLRNLRASTDPNKQDAKRHLSEVKPKKKFPEDFRKFSFNNELSYNVGAFGIGSTAESNVIYSQKSFVPRSTSLNLTTEIFGHSFNIVELDGRVENLDRLIEHYFGPKGELRAHEIQELAEGGKKSLSGLYERIEKRFDTTFRARREIKQDNLNKFAKKVKLDTGKMNSDDLEVDLSLKMFGVELAYTDYHGAGVGADPDHFIDKIFDLLDFGVKEAKEFDKHIESHVHFMDADLVYPTGLGVPLSLGVTGDSVVHLKASGNFDVRSMMRDSANAAIRLSLEPSAAVSIVGTMVVNGFGAETGLRLVSTLHTSTGSDLSVKLLGGKGIDVSFGIPKRKQEIVRVSSEVLFVTPDANNKYVSPKFTKGRQHKDCFDQFSALLGVTVCGELYYPYDNIESVQKKPVFPLSGPGKFAISVENNDVTNYHFRVFYDFLPDGQSLEITIETPDSKTNRKVAFKIAGSCGHDTYFKVSLDSPYKQLSAEARVNNKPNEKSLTLKGTNDIDTYFLRAGIASDSGNKYKPLLEYKVPEHIEKLASSKTGMKGGSGKREGQLYKVKGDVEVNDGKYQFNKVVLMAADRELASLDGYVSRKPNGIMLDTKISHGEENIAIKMDAQRNGEKLNLDLAVVPSKDPNIGFKIHWHFDRPEADLLDQEFIFIYGPDLDSKVNRLTISDKLMHKKSAQSGTGASTPAAYLKRIEAIKTESKITWPAEGLSSSLEIEASQTAVDIEMKFVYGKFKIGSELELGVDKENGHDAKLKFKAHLLESKIALELKRKKLAEHKNKLEACVELPGGGKYEADAEVTYDVSKNNVNIKVDADLGLNGKKVKMDYGIEANPQKTHGHAVLTLDAAKYFDFIFKLQHGANPHGNFNLHVKNILIAGGQFDYQNGKGNANVNVDLPSFHRKIKGTGDMNVSGNKYVANLEILLDAEKDPSKRIKVSSDSDVTKESIDSKNLVEIGKYKTEVNVKGSMKNNGKSGYQGEGTAEITLPNDHFIVVKAIHHLVRDGKRNRLDGSYQFSDSLGKGGKTAKLIYETELAWADSSDAEYIGKHSLGAHSYDGKTLKLDVSGSHERVPDSDKRKSELITSFEGSFMPKAFLFALYGNYNAQEGDWKTKFAVGKDLGVKGQGSYKRGNLVDIPATNEFVLDFVLPSEKLSSLKLQSSESVLTSHEKDGNFAYKGSKSMTYNGDKNIKAEIEMHHKGIPDSQQGSEGDAKIVLTLLNNSPLSVETSYKCDPTSEMKKASGKLGVKYGEKEATLASDLAYSADLNVVSLHAKGTTPVDKFRNVELKLARKRSQDDIHAFDALLVADDTKYTLNSQVQLSPTVTSIAIVMTCPAGKTELLSKFKVLGDNVYTGEWKVDSPKGFVTADGRVKADSVDNFVIELNFDSDKIKHRKIHAEIATKPAVKSGKRIIVTVTSDGKNIVTGSTNYNKRDEAGKVIVEGNGNLKIGENTRSSKFTYSRKQLTQEVDGEVGVAILLNTNFGPSAVVGELKLSNKEIHVFNSYCEQSKDCAHFKLQSAFDTDQNSQMNHQLTVEVNLKKFNVPVEFGLKTNTKYHLKEPIFDHTANLYVHTSKDKTQYSSQVYVHAKDSAFILTLPSREVALISSYEIPKTRHSGAVKVEVSVYLDRKNKPNDKTSFVATGDVNIEKNSGALSGEAKFTYPSQTKDMAVNGRLHYGGDNLLDASLDLDVFAKKTQKVSVTAKVMRLNIPKGYNVTGELEVVSRGQQLKVDLKQHASISASQIGFGSFLSYTDQHQKPKNAGIMFAMDSTEFVIEINAPDKELLEFGALSNLHKGVPKFDVSYTILDNKPIHISYEGHDSNSFKFQIGELNDSKNKLTVNGRFVLGQLAEIHADVFKNGEKMNLFSVLVHLDEGKFLKPDFSYSKDNIVALIDFWRERGINIAKQWKEAGQVVAQEVVVEFKDLFQHLKKASPNLHPLVEYYQEELTKLKNELHADETIKEIQATLHKVFGGVIVAVTETLKQLASHMVEMDKQLHQIAEKLGEAVKATYPHLKQSFDKIFQAGIEIFDAAAKLGTIYLKAILNVMNEHQKEIKHLLGVAAELVQDVAKIIVKGTSQIEKEVKEFIVLVVQQIKALPIYEFVKEKYAELANYQVPDAILVPIEEAYVQLRKILPTEELREFFTVTYDYIMKHVKRQKVDDTSEIKKIWGAGIEAIQSMLSLIQNHNTFEKLFSFYIVRLPADISAFKNLPGIATLRLSVLNLLKNRELPTPADVYYAYRPTLYPSDIVAPFSKTGVFLEGGHFFTFDGRHVTMAGTCDYIVAQDMRDGNFSVVASLASGKLTSVTVTAPGETITIKSNGNILANAKPAEYPVSTKNLHAFLTPPIVNVKSDYGIHLMCTPKSPMTCGLHVSGFYLGKVRGILGDGNNEPYDDFTLPSGHITEDEAEFGNAYKLNSGCAAAPAVDHKTHNRDPTCTEYFSGNSPMSSCFNYVDPTNYRQACDHATSAGTQQAACLISGAYWSACLKERVFISVPNACRKCKVKNDEIAVDDSFSVKIPQKQADIIFVVEQEQENEKVFKDLVQPLMNDIRAEFKQHGITDVHVGLIGYGEHMKWPQHYTTGGSTNIDGEVFNMKFAARTPLITMEEAKTGDTRTRLKYLKQRLDVEFSVSKLTDAYEEAIRYPFRAGAAKVVIGVMTSPCEKSPLPVSLQQLRLLLGHKVYRDLGLTYYHVSFLDDILVSGKPQKNVIGFDAHSAYTFADSKKKPLEGSSDMRNNLVLANNDVCANFAVNSGGAAFAVDHFNEAKPNQKKQFAQVAARRIVEGAVNTEIEEDCVCHMRMGINARPHCKIVARKEKEPLAVRDLRGNKDDNATRQVITSLADLLVNPEEMARAIELRIHERLADLLISDDPYLREKVAIIYGLMCRTADGSEAILRQPKILHYLSQGLADPLDVVRGKMARVIEVLARHPIVAEDLCVYGFVDVLLERIVDEEENVILIVHLESLESLTLPSDKFKTEALEKNALETLLALIERNQEEKVVGGALSCLAVLCQVPLGKEKSTELNVLTILKPLLDDQRGAIRAKATSLIVFATTTTQGRCRAFELDFTEKLVNFAVDSLRDRELQLASLKALSNIAEIPAGRSMLLSNYAMMIEDIDTGGDETAEKFKNILLEIIRWRP